MGETLPCKHVRQPIIGRTLYADFLQADDSDPIGFVDRY